jgi:hypothetical protein
MHAVQLASANTEAAAWAFRVYEGCMVVEFGVITLMWRKMWSGALLPHAVGVSPETFLLLLLHRLARMSTTLGLHLPRIH